MTLMLEKKTIAAQVEFKISTKEVYDFFDDVQNKKRIL